MRRHGAHQGRSTMRGNGRGMFRRGNVPIVEAPDETITLPQDVLLTPLAPPTPPVTATIDASDTTVWTWEQFHTTFLDRFMPESVKDSRVYQFEQLRQDPLALGGRGQGSQGHGQARVYALTPQDAQASNDVVTSILRVYSTDAHILFDPSASVAPHNLISAIGARQMMPKAYKSYLDFVRDSEGTGPSLEQVRVAVEFSDVFPDELSGLPPDWDIKFCINLTSSSNLISILPYHITPTELTELKEQFHDLLDNGFI
ncbi:DNA/RNA polymerases superfamily protein [Quillaja saponaria]|uniref:DNA/RNA polymerases superfamily protein n=1 Tax=Quillaja saponaria TaxID=32244 RepID=A0AAD7L3Z0_QUISA|nr:DNA/RNA polymerases superfamily protein [Quillaja saponaria]